MMKTTTIAIGLLMALRLTAAVTVTEEPQDGETVYRLENERVVLVITPAHGGAVTSYRDKAGDNVELVPKSKYTGFCMDHFQSQTWPGELLETPYAGRLVKQDAAEVVVEVTRDVEGQYRGDPYPKLAGLRLVKTYTLRAGSPALQCTVTLTAPAKQAKVFAYWQQHVAYAGGTLEEDTDFTYRPSTRGVRVKNGRPGQTGTEDFLRDAAGGWIAMIDQQTHTGFASIGDWNQVRFLYCNVGNHTVETMFLPQYLPAGESASYTLWVVPFSGLPNVVTATPDYIAGATITSDGQGTGEVALSVVRAVTAPATLTVDLRLHSALEGAGADLPTFTFADLAEQPRTQTAKFTGAGVDPLVVDGTSVADGDRRHAFMDYFNGAYKWGDNLTTDMVTPVYSAAPPAREISIFKPPKLALSRPGQRHFWYVEGLGDDAYRTLECLHMTANLELGGGSSLTRVTTRKSAFGTELSDFPFDYDELLGYNCLVLGGLRADSLGQIGMIMVGDYIAAGGGVVMLGGPVAYGRAAFAGTPVADWLPVVIKDTPAAMLDLGGAPLVPAEPDSWMLRDLDWAAAPRVRFLHDVEVKPDARVLVTAGGHPVLVVQQVGPRGARVACWLAPALGSFADPAATGFWAWADWPYLARRVCWWTLHHERVHDPYNPWY